MFTKHKGRFGSPRIHAELKKQQVACSLGRVKRLMRRKGLYAVSTPRYRPKHKRSEVVETRNLLQEGLDITGIDQLWHVDITYIPTDEGWLYLAGVIDGFSKRMVGYAMAEQMKTELVMQALQSAVNKRKPAPGLIHQSDRGSQYTSHLYGTKLAAQGMLPSFTGKGACFDNAVIESFWATLKRELVCPGNASRPVLRLVPRSSSLSRFTTTANDSTVRSTTRLRKPTSACSTRQGL